MKKLKKKSFGGIGNNFGGIRKKKNIWGDRTFLHKESEITLEEQYKRNEMRAERASKNREISDMKKKQQVEHVRSPEMLAIDAKGRQDKIDAFLLNSTKSPTECPTRVVTVAEGVYRMMDSNTEGLYFDGSDWRIAE